MTCTINASTSSSAIVSTADGSGILKIMSNGVTTNALAWVNFNGVTTVTVNSQYNISSITRVSAGIYTLNFTNSLTDANYVLSGMTNNNNASWGINLNASSVTAAPAVKSTSQVQIVTGSTTAAGDMSNISVIVFGN